MSRCDMEDCKGFIYAEMFLIEEGYWCYICKHHYKEERLTPNAHGYYVLTIWERISVILNLHRLKWFIQKNVIWKIFK